MKNRMVLQHLEDNRWAVIYWRKIILLKAVEFKRTGPRYEDLEKILEKGLPRSRESWWEYNIPIEIRSMKIWIVPPHYCVCPKRANRTADKVIDCWVPPESDDGRRLLGPNISRRGGYQSGWFKFTHPCARLLFRSLKGSHEGGGMSPTLTRQIIKRWSWRIWYSNNLSKVLLLKSMGITGKENGPPLVMTLLGTQRIYQSVCAGL